MFPPCIHAGHAKPGDRRFCRLKSPAKLVHLQTCLACPHAGSFTTRLEPICSPPIEDEARPCVHRGGQLRTVTVANCCGGETVPILSCSVHGECSVEKRDGNVNLCVGCGDRRSPGAVDLPPLGGPANLMWFVYPKRSTREVWERQQEIIRNAICQFDGKKVCAVAVDDSTDQTAVDRHLWDEIIELPNDPQQWELPGWRWAMSRLKGLPGFTVRLHAKGSSRGVNEIHMQAWWELGYESLLDVGRVREALQRAVVAGPFRRNVRAPNLGVPWHFSGSLYAFRNDAVFSGNWEPAGRVATSHYVEAWPALMAPEQAACLGWDGCRDLYQVKNWREVPTAAKHPPALPAANPPPCATNPPLTEPFAPRCRSPQISLVVPAWNESTRIEQCLHALQAQTFRDFEAIIVDDGSTDGTAATVARLVGDDPRFGLVLKEHSGIGATLNRGFETCRADLLTWASADSWMLPNWLETLKKALDDNPDKVMAYSDWQHVDSDGKTTVVHEPEFDRKSLQMRCRIGVCWLFRASAKAKAGPYVNDPCEDYYMHLMLSGVGDFVHVPVVLGAWRNHPDNISSTICNPTKWAASSIVKAKARWQQARYRVAYLCPNLDAASVGWLHFCAVNDISDDFAVRHILGDTTHVTPGVDARLCPPDDSRRLTDEARQILAEADLIHVNNDFPDRRPDVWEIIRRKPLVIHMHGGRWQWDSARLREWKERGVPILTCTPGHSVAEWIPNVMPIGSEHLTNAVYYTPIARSNAKLRLLCHHNYPAGKGVDQLTDVLDGIDEVIFGRTLKHRVDWSLATDKKMTLLDHLEIKRPFDICVDTLTHGYAGMATWEAMAMAQAVVCRIDERTQTEYRRYFGSSPPIVSPHRIDDLVDELAEMFRNPAMVRDRGQANREWIEASYSAVRILDRYEAIYRKAIGGCRP